MDQSGLPAGTVVEGYTGNSGDRLTIKVPQSGNGNKSIKLNATGKDSRSTANVFLYAPNNSSYQRVIAKLPGQASVATASITMNTPKYGKIKLIKKGTDDALIDGVKFGLYTPKNSRRKQAAAAVRLPVMRRSRRIRFWPLSGEGDNSIISITVSPTW